MGLDLGNILRQKVTNLRTGRLIFEGVEPSLVRVSLTDILDDTVLEHGDPVHKSLGKQILPLLNLDLDGNCVFH